MASLQEIYCRECAFYEKLRCLEPTPRPHRDREETLADDRKILNGYLQTISAKNDLIVKTWITEECHYSTKKLDELKPVTLNQMLCPKIHKDQFLPCCIISEFYGPHAAFLLVEDSNNDVEVLALTFRTNVNQNLKVTSIKKHYPIVFVKEPQLVFQDVNKAMILVESLDDLVMVDEADEKLLRKAGAEKWLKPDGRSIEEIIKTAELYEKASWCKEQYKGTEMESLDFEEMAIKYCRRALRMDPNNVEALLILAKALTGRRNGEALEIVQMAMEQNAVNREKALMALSSIHLSNSDWSSTLQTLEAVIQDFPHSPVFEQAKMGATLTAAYLNESTTGAYDLLGLHDQAYNQHMLSLDIGDYHGPVEIRDIPGKGKGLIATRDVAKGELLIACKPFSCTFDTNPSDGFKVFDKIVGGLRRGSQLELISKTMECLQKKSHHFEEFYSLDGGYADREEPMPQVLIDPGRIQRICIRNSFGIDPNHMRPHGSPEEIGKHKIPNGLGLKKISGNTWRVFLGDVIFIRAIKDIKKGEEVLTTYVGPTLKFVDRQAHLKQYGFQCSCDLCSQERQDHLMEELRDAIDLEVKKLTFEILKKDPAPHIDRLQELADDMRQTYDPSSKYKICLLGPIYKLGWTYYVMENWSKATKALEDLREISNTDVLKYENFYGYREMLAECYKRLGQKEKFNKWKRESFELFQAKTGADMGLFEKIHPIYVKKSK